ncbi:hypothetical protein YC2023_020765 [Brassica napus]
MAHTSIINAVSTISTAFTLFIGAITKNQEMSLCVKLVHLKELVQPITFATNVKYHSTKNVSSLPL